MGDLVNYLIGGGAGGNAAPVPVGSLAAAFSSAQNGGGAAGASTAGAAPGAAAGTTGGSTGAGTTPPASIDPLAYNGMVPISPQDEMNPAYTFNSTNSFDGSTNVLLTPQVGATWADNNPLVQAYTPPPPNLAAASYPDASANYRSTWRVFPQRAIGSIPYASETNPYYTIGKDGFAHLNPRGQLAAKQEVDWYAAQEQAAEAAQGGFFNSTFGQLLAGFAPIALGALGFFAAPALGAGAAAAGAGEGASSFGSVAGPVLGEAAAHAALGAGMSWATGGNPLTGALGGALSGGIGGIGDAISPGLGGFFSTAAGQAMGAINAENQGGGFSGVSSGTAPAAAAAPASSVASGAAPTAAAGSPVATTGLAANDWWNSGNSGGQ